MTTVFKIEAVNEDKVREKVKKKLEEDRKDLSSSTRVEDLIKDINLVKEKRGFLGFGRKRKIYEVVLYEDAIKEETDSSKDIEKKEENNMIDEELNDKELDIDVDGEFQLKITSEGVMIRILPPQAEGKPVRYQQVKQELDNKNIVEEDWGIVKEAVEKAEAEWVKIAPRKPELDKDAEVQVNISGDKLQAFIDYYPALGGQELSLRDIKHKLKATGVKFGINEKRLTKLIKIREKRHDVLIAEGTPPVPGEDGRLIYHFEEKKNAVGSEKADGSIDFHNLSLINNVKKGDILVTREAAQPGQPGTAVTGDEIPPPEPETVELPPGKNIEEKDENTLQSQIEGQVVITNNKVDVLPVYKIDGDVDLSTGNIDFIGSVVVRGDVLEGFSINAGGNVEVKGNVTGAVIKSEGQVVIHKGFIGKEKGKVETRGDIRIKFVENGSLYTDQSIYVSDAVMHSNLKAVETIEVTARKGLIVGGECKAGRKIEANMVGSNLATATRLELGIDSESRKSIQELKEKIDSDQENLDKTNKALKLLNNLKENKKLSPEKKNMLAKLRKTKDRLQEILDESQKQLERLKEKYSELSNSRVVINEKAFPGTTLVINGFQYKINDELRKAVFMLEAGEIRQVSA